MGKFAWVTLATNDSYSMGALVLAHSLRRVNTVHQLVVLITPGVTEAMKTQLSAVYNAVKLVDVLDSGDADNLELLARPELGITFTKLHCWKLIEFDKCVFLDADTLVLQNSDELFEREELSAAPDAGWPDCFNSGVFVYKPNQETFKALIEFALIHGSFDGGDQGLLNLFFSDWATKDIQKHLPFVYNMCSTATYSYLPAFKQFGSGLKIIHFIGGAKPWLQPFNTETGLVSVSGESQHLVQFVQMWWDIFCAHVHPTLSTEMAGLAGALATVTLGAPLTVEQRALEEHLRRQGWEQGNIDYMGKDSFANIWLKICETLGVAAPPEDAPAPVAPVAAPVYVSSVEISPTGQIDKTPPQANYAPVSALKPTVEVSDTKDVTKASASETTTVAPEPKSSVTEVISTEASVTPSATLETSTPIPQVSSESTTVQQPGTPVESAVKTETAPITPVVPPTETPASKEILATAPTPTETSSAVIEPPTSTPPVPIKTEIPVSSIDVPTTVASAVAPPATAAPDSTPTPLAPKEIPVSTPPLTEAVSTPPAPTVTETAPVPAPKEAPVSTPPAPTEISVPSTPAPTEPPVSTPSVTAQVETSISAAPAPTEAPVATTPALTPAEPPKEVPTPVSKEVPAPTPAPTEAPIPTPPAPTPTETPVSKPAPTEAPVPSPPAPAPAPIQTPDVTPAAPAPTEPAPPTPPVSPASAPTPTEPSAPAPVPASAEAPGNVPTPTSESIAAAKVEPAQPETPTVTEPTPPTSPPVAAEAPQLTKLQVEADVPGTPPVGASTQPSLEGAAAAAEEPPVPPKRKGGSKAPQDSKNQKGGKPSKGKK